MNEERGAALRLLYQMKLGLEKAHPDSFPNVSPVRDKTITGLTRMSLDKKYEEVLQLKQTLPMTSKYQTMNRSKKLEPIEKTLLKFEHTKKLQDDQAYAD